MKILVFLVALLASALSVATPPDDNDNPTKRSKIEDYQQEMEEKAKHICKSIQSSWGNHLTIFNNIFNEDASINESKAPHFSISQLTTLASLLHWDGSVEYAKTLTDWVLKQPSLLAQATDRELNLMSPIAEYWTIYKILDLKQQIMVTALRNQKDEDPSFDQYKFYRDLHISWIVKDQVNPKEEEPWAFQSLQWQMLSMATSRKLTFGSQFWGNRITGNKSPK